MSLIDKLMTIDTGEYAKDKEAELKSPSLSEYFGEPIKIKIKAVPGQRFTELATGLVDSKGNQDLTKAYTVNAMLVTEGLIDPNLKDKDLQKKFGCATPKDLAIKLFKGGEINTIAAAITQLSGFRDEDDLKN